QGAAGIYHQAPAPEEVSAVFGTPTLSLSRAIQVTAGAKMELTGTLALEVTGFYEKLNSLVVRSAQPSPMLATVLDQDGTGQSLRAQFLIRQELADGLFGWVSYTISRSVRRDAPSSSQRLFDYDQTHVLSLVLSYEIASFIFGTRLRYATGFPRTPV